MIFLLVLALIAAALKEPTLAFVPIGSEVTSHVTITGTALRQKVKETCKAVLEKKGYEFVPLGNSPEEIAEACLSPMATGVVSGAKFLSALQDVYNQNALIDKDFANSDPHHFNSEMFLEGRSLITVGVAAIKANIQNKNFQAARETLGKVLHTLQDFYSHSNWVELGFKEPYINLIRPSDPLENIADINTPTCKDCPGGTCRNQLLSAILQYQKLTSGYMGIASDKKPNGKCSHGGSSDKTSLTFPQGGIHKDERRPDNQNNHDTAVELATEASLQLLEDIRLAVGDEDFLRMMGIARSAVVVFVIDTTGSMSDDIEAVVNLTDEMIESKIGTQDEPSEYILVPFNDPGVGPVFKTFSHEEIKKEISKLGASGGGDYPEMSFGAIQLALTTAPFYSEIYVFTDASAKDAHLLDTILALLKTTKSKVSFALTAEASKRRRRSTSIGIFDNYKELALASGGQIIQVTKEQLSQATDIILDTSTSALVTILQQARNPGKPDEFSFSLDESLKNITFYITGKSPTFTLTNPEGVSQTSSQSTGSLATITTVGNLWRSTINPERASGTWKIAIASSNPYTLKITGQSTIAFIYDFVEKFEGPHPGYTVLTGRPKEGQPTSLILPVMGRKGPDSLKITEVSLISMTDNGIVSTNTFTDMGNGGILATLPVVPKGEFVVLMRGIDMVSNTEFQRQSTTLMSVSKVNIQASVSSTMEPGKPFTLPFSVFTNGTGGLYKIDARNDRGFPMSSPTSLTLTSGQYTNTTLTIMVPANTISGTDVTLTLDASLGADSNYVVLRLSVLEKITDFYPPLCEIVHMNNPCLTQSVQWDLVANLTDGKGTGIESVHLQQGNGTLTKVTDGDPIQYRYNASCLSNVVEIVVVDKVRNVGRCYYKFAVSSVSAERLSVVLMVSLLFTGFFV